MTSLSNDDPSGSKQRRRGRCPSGCTNLATATILVALPFSTSKAWAFHHPRSPLALSIPTSRTKHSHFGIITKKPSLLLSDKQQSLPVALFPSRPSSPRRRHNVLTSSTALSSTGYYGGEAPSLNYDLEYTLNNLDPTSLPLLHIAEQVGSTSHGTLHYGYLILPNPDFDPNSNNNANNGNGYPYYTLQPCVAKRPYTLSELQAKDPTKVFGLRTRALEMHRYFEVEKHCFQKLEEFKLQNQIYGSTIPYIRNNYRNPTNNNVVVSAAYFGTFGDDGSGSGGAAVLNGGMGDFGGEDSAAAAINGENRPREWMAFEYVGSGMDEAFVTLSDAMQMEHWNGSHHLSNIQRALNLPEEYEFGDVLDAVFRSILENLVFVHACNLVHRNVSPSNLLCDGQNQRLRLQNFSGAADLDPSPIPGRPNDDGTVPTMGTQRVGLTANIASFSPAYAAPEKYVRLDNNPLAFDVFSASMVMCQLLFNLIDDETGAGFAIERRDANDGEDEEEVVDTSGYDLDLWLERELRAEFQSSSFRDALNYLSERRGLWRLLKKMFEPNPKNRFSSLDALKELDEVMGLKKGEREWTDQMLLNIATDEAFLERVIDFYEQEPMNFATDDETVEADTSGDDQSADEETWYDESIAGVGDESEEYYNMAQDAWNEESKPTPTKSDVPSYAQNSKPRSIQALKVGTKTKPPPSKGSSPPKPKPPSVPPLAKAAPAKQQIVQKTQAPPKPKRNTGSEEFLDITSVNFSTLSPTALSAPSNRSPSRMTELLKKSAGRKYPKLSKEAKSETPPVLVDDKQPLQISASNDKALPVLKQPPGENRETDPKVTAMENEISSLKTEIATLSKTARQLVEGTLLNDVEKEKREAEKLREENSELKKQVRELTLRGDEFEDIVDENVEEKKLLLKKIDYIEGKLDKTQEQLVFTTDKLDEALLALQTERKNLSEERSLVKALSLKVETYQFFANEHKEEKKLLIEKMRAIESDLSRTKLELETKSDELDSTILTLETAKKKMSKQEDAIEELTRRVQKYQDLADNYASDNESLLRQIVIIEKDLSRTQLELESKSDELDAVIASRKLVEKSLFEDLENERKESSDLREFNAQLKEQVDELIRRVESHHDFAIENAGEKRLLAENISKVEEELSLAREALKSKTKEAEAAKKNLEAEKEKLSQEVQKLRSVSPKDPLSEDEQNLQLVRVKQMCDNLQSENARLKSEQRYLQALADSAKSGSGVKRNDDNSSAIENNSTFDEETRAKLEDVKMRIAKADEVLAESLSETMSSDPQETSVDTKTSSFDEDAWIQEQNRLIEERRIARLEREEQLARESLTKEDTADPQQLEDDQNWIKEQNRVVEERRLARLQKANHLEADGNRKEVNEDSVKAKHFVAEIDDITNDVDIKPPEDEAEIDEKTEQVEKKSLEALKEEARRRYEDELVNNDTLPLLQSEDTLDVASRQYLKAQKLSLSSQLDTENSRRRATTDDDHFNTTRDLLSNSAKSHISKPMRHYLTSIDEYLSTRSDIPTSNNEREWRTNVHQGSGDYFDITRVPLSSASKASIRNSGKRRQRIASDGRERREFDSIKSACLRSVVTSVNNNANGATGRISNGSYQRPRENEDGTSSDFDKKSRRKKKSSNDDDNDFDYFDITRIPLPKAKR